jgi:hypothetical protein
MDCRRQERARVGDCRLSCCGQAFCQCGTGTSQALIWQSICLSLAQSVLGSGPGVATAAERLRHSFAWYNSAFYQLLWEAFERFYAYTGWTALPAPPPCHSVLESRLIARRGAIARYFP